MTGATVPDAVRLAFPCSHVLVHSVAGYLAGGLLAGNAVAVVATPEHRRLFAQALIDAGVDVVGTLPDPARFHEAGTRAVGFG